MQRQDRKQLRRQRDVEGKEWRVNKLGEQKLLKKRIEQQNISNQGHKR